MSYGQAAIATQNQPAFDVVKAAMDAVFAPPAVGGFLRSLEKRKVRIREFEAVLAQGLLRSPQAAASYASLGASDQGQIREYYLTQVEQVDSGIRKKFYKLYAYY